ncbi:MAG: hypothetical protein AAB533_00260 [Patescibacteria group bacterium]
MATALRYLRIHDQFFVFSRRAPYLVLRDAGITEADDAHREHERIVAQLCVDLIERYQYRLSQLHVRELIPIVSQEGWKYPEVDLLIEGKDGNPRLLIKAFPRAQYEASLDAGIDELFFLARAIPSRRTTPLFIVPYTRWYERRAVREEYLVINASVFPTKEAWIAAGKALEHAIPKQG